MYTCVSVIDFVLICFCDLLIGCSTVMSEPVEGGEYLVEVFVDGVVWFVCHYAY